MGRADVIVLNEVDWGMRRTDYRNVAADLASALGMNYAYGVAFVGKFKLDWIFVKPFALAAPYGEEGPHRFAPHFGRTRKSLNDAPPRRCVRTVGKVRRLTDKTESPLICWMC